jgi:hypothetical protein
MNAVKPLTDRMANPPACGASVKFRRNQGKEGEEGRASSARSDLEALGDKMKTNGTHTVAFDGKDVQAVVFEGRAGPRDGEVEDGQGGHPLQGSSCPMITSAGPPAFLGGPHRDGGALPFPARLRRVTVNRIFGKLQLASSAYMGFSHGRNDATKCMGIITLALVAGTNAGLFRDHGSLWGWLATPAGSDALKLGLGDRLVAALPGFLQFGLPAFARGCEEPGRAGLGPSSSARSPWPPGRRPAAGRSSRRSGTRMVKAPARAWFWPRRRTRSHRAGDLRQPSHAREHHARDHD